MKKLLILLFFINTLNTFSQLTLNQRSGSFTYSANNLPKVSIELKAEYNNVQIDIPKSNLLLIESSYPNYPDSIYPQVNGWQKVEWRLNYNSVKDDSTYYLRMMLSYKNTVATDSLLTLIFTPLINFIDDKNDVITEYQFPNFQLGQQLFPQTISFIQDRTIFVGSSPVPIRIDSITTNTPYFKFKDTLWQNITYNGGYHKLPAQVISGFKYSFDLEFYPDQIRFYSDILTIHYEGGAKKYLNIFANAFAVKDSSQIQIIKPNGGEKLAPCQRYEIKWKGYNTNIDINIEASYNGGKSWVKIGTAQDSNFFWTVPNIITKQVLIRVSQGFLNPKYSILSNNSANRVSISPNGSRLLASTDFNTTIKEYDLKTLSTTPINNYSQNTPNINHQQSGLTYLSDNGFISGYFNANLANNKDTLEKFDLDNPVPISKTEFLDFHISNFKVDKTNDLIALYPKLGSSVNFHSLSTLVKLQTLSFNYPIVSISLNSQLSLALITLINGQNFIYSTKNYQLIKQINLVNLPYITQSELSPNGTQLANACVYNNNGSTIISITDLQSNQTWKYYTQSKNYSNCVNLSFSPTSTSLIVAFENYPSLAVFDMVNNISTNPNWPTAGSITNMVYSESGNAVATSSNGSTPLLTYGNFYYAQKDVSDNVCEINYPGTKIADLNFGSDKIFHQSKRKISLAICDTSDIPFNIDSKSLKDSRHFQLLNNQGIVINPKECIDLELMFSPQDTGRVSDTLFLRSCNGNKAIEIYGYGIDRNTKFSQNIYDMGQSCVGDTVTKTFDMLQNLDTIPLIITSGQIRNQRSSEVKFISNNLPDTLAPGETYKATIQFVPDTIGSFTCDLYLYHSDQLRYSKNTKISAQGIGTYVDISHDTLAFIPERKSRFITLKNTGVDPVLINNIELSSIHFQSLTALPITVKSGASQRFDFTWDGTPFTDETIKLDATPCLVQRFIRIKNYSANTNLTILDVNADPKNETEIIINYSTNEPIRYKGNRPFEALLNVDFKHFYPLNITSKFDSSSFVNEGVENDYRIVRLKLEGDFSGSGELLRLKGNAGLSDKDNSSILIKPNPLAFGQNVKVNSNIGVFTLINLCGNRKVTDSKSVNFSIFPNPVNSLMYLLPNNLDFTTNSNFPLELNIYDILGEKVLAKSLNISSNEIIPIDLNNIKLGTYLLESNCLGIIQKQIIQVVK